LSGCTSIVQPFDGGYGLGYPGLITQELLSIVHSPETTSHIGAIADVLVWDVVLVVLIVVDVLVVVVVDVLVVVVVDVLVVVVVDVLVVVVDVLVVVVVDVLLVVVVVVDVLVVVVVDVLVVVVGLLVLEVVLGTTGQIFHPFRVMDESDSHFISVFGTMPSFGPSVPEYS